MKNAGLPFILCYIYRSSANIAVRQSILFEYIEVLARDKLPECDFLRFNLRADSSFAIYQQAIFYLLQLLTESTRITASTATLIDHIYVSARSLISEPGVVNSHLSDCGAIFSSLFSDRNGSSKKRQFVHNTDLFIV